MQRTNNLKRVVVITIILSLLITIGVAFFRGGAEEGNSIHLHGYEKIGAHHNDH